MLKIGGMFFKQKHFVGCQYLFRIKSLRRLKYIELSEIIWQTSIMGYLDGWSSYILKCATLLGIWKLTTWIMCMTKILSTSCKKDLPCPSFWRLVLVDSNIVSEHVYNTSEMCQCRTLRYTIHSTSCIVIKTWWPM